MIKKQYGDVMMVGQSGNKYRFGTWPLGTRFRSVAAVYFVSKRFVQETTFRRARHEARHEALRRVASRAPRVRRFAGLGARELGERAIERVVVGARVEGAVELLRLARVARAAVVEQAEAVDGDGLSVGRSDEREAERSVRG